MLLEARFDFAYEKLGGPQDAFVHVSVHEPFRLCRYVCLCVYACGWVGGWVGGWVCEKERASERERVCVGVHACACVCACVCKWNIHMI